MSSALITGFPGFLAKNIIKELRKQQAYSKIYVLVLPSQTAIAEKMIEELKTLDYLTSNAESIISKGNITCPDFIQTIPAMIAFYNKHKHDSSFHIPIK